MEEKLIEEIEVQGRKRTYRITEKGRTVYREEVERLRTCLSDAMDAERGILRQPVEAGAPALAMP
jgi:DNA-binding PadR family transcriptional regulator